MVAGTRQLAERVQLRGARPAEQPVPGLGADPGDYGEVTVGDAEADRALQAGDVRQQVAHGLLAARVHGQHEEDGRGGQRDHYRLRLGRGFWLHGHAPFGADED